MLWRSKFRKQTIAALVLGSFLFAMPAQALIAPLVVWLGGAAAFANAVELSTIAIGAVIAFVKFNAPTSSGNQNPIIAQLAPDAPLPTPTGWTPSTGATGSKGKPTGISIAEIPGGYSYANYSSAGLTQA